MQAQYRWLAFLRDLLRRNVVTEDSYFEFFKCLGCCGKGIMPQGYTQGKP